MLTGELFNQTGTTTNSYLYTGQQFDSLTSLYSLRARYYAPNLGRFLSQDTYPYDFSNPVELNRYVYTANNPTNLTDPSGHQSSTEYSMLLTMMRGAVTGAAQGFIAGSVFGIVASLACTGSVDIGFIAGAAASGALGGAAIGASAMILGGPATLTMGFSLLGVKSAYADYQAHGANACNLVIGMASLVSFFIGFGGLVSGGTPFPPALLPVAVGANGGGYSIASVSQGVSGNLGGCHWHCEYNGRRRWRSKQAIPKTWRPKWCWSS